MDTLYIKTTLDISVLQSESSQVQFSRKPRYNKKKLGLFGGNLTEISIN